MQREGAAVATRPGPAGVTSVRFFTAIARILEGLGILGQEIVAHVLNALGWTLAFTPLPAVPFGHPGRRAREAAA